MVARVIEGVFRLQMDGHKLAARKGDTVRIPKDTELACEGDKARTLYAVDPGNWREKLTIYE